MACSTFPTTVCIQEVPWCLQIEVPIEPDEGVVADAPLVFCYGHTDINHNMDVYKTQIKRFDSADLLREF
jgi:hypothetical protein